MDVRLRLPEDPDGGELQQLYDWLIRDHTVRPYADISLRPDPDASGGTDSDDDGTTMGDTVDLVALVLDTGFQLISLGIAIAAWRQAQRPRSSVVVERDGNRVTLPAGAGPDDWERAWQTLERTDGTTPRGPGDTDRHPDDPPPEGDPR